MAYIQETIAETTLQELIRSPKFPLVLKQLQEILTEEQQKRIEFYDTITEQDKVEFINGEVVFQSPVRYTHDVASGALFILLRTFVQMRDLGYVGHEKMMISLTRNDYEPDICYFTDAKAQTFQPDQTRFPAPDFVAEILSPTTEDIDRGTKFRDYAAHGVSEYWLVDPDRQIVEQYILQGESYELLTKSTSGNVQSVAVAGFEIPIRAIFDREENLTTLQQIIQSVS